MKPLLIFVDNQTGKTIAEEIISAVPSKGDMVDVMTPSGNAFGEVIEVQWHITPMMRPQVYVSIDGVVINPLQDYQVAYYDKMKAGK